MACAKHVLFLRNFTFFYCFFAQTLSIILVSNILVFDTAIKCFNTNSVRFDTLGLPRQYVHLEGIPS